MERVNYKKNSLQGASSSKPVSSFYFNTLCILCRTIFRDND